MKRSKYYFLLGFVVVNAVALTGFDPWYIGALISFLFIVSAPGMLVLPFLLKKKVGPPFGVAMGVAFSLLLLMLGGLAINTLLPFFGNATPLTLIPLLCTFDVIVLFLLLLNVISGKELPIEFRPLTSSGWWIVAASSSLPILACLGAISLNNNGSNGITLFALALVIVLVIIVLANQGKIDPMVPPITLFMMALAFLLMNSMRGWFITGHDILLEYHVFTLVDNAGFWSMSLYKDPYMACLSLTILPTYLQNLLHMNPTYIFKFFLQFLGALPVVVIYYLGKEYVSSSIAFLSGFLYITFPTFMTDMAFLNRQGIAFIFFSIMIFVLLNTDYMSAGARTTALLLFATGMVLSHYSTSYVAVALLIGAYFIDRIVRWIMTAEWPRWFARLTDHMGNKQGYAARKLLTFPFVIGVFAIIILWSVVITRTSSNLVNTIQQIATNVVRPFSLEQSTGIAAYNILQTKSTAPSTPAATKTPFEEFEEAAAAQAHSSAGPSDFYSASTLAQYPVVTIPEPTVPLTALGVALQSFVRDDLNDFYNNFKQAYAKIIQALLLIGLLGLLIGFSFRRNLLKDPPAEYVALMISGIGILMGQTILPASAVDYGLLRLFQQNLIFLALPTTLALIALCSLVARNAHVQAFFCGIILLFFFFILSGIFPQFTGGGRPPLTLDNYGFYYNAYYTHAQEVAALQWIATNHTPYIPIQSDRYFSTIKMITYTGIAPLPGLFPSVIENNAYVYLNYNNVKTGEVIEYVDGEVIYYQFPLDFLASNKNLIYNDGGSEIYK